MPDTVKVYAYKGFNADGESFCFNCADETINAAGYNFFKVRNYAGALARVSEQNSRTLDLAFEVPPAELLKTTGLSAAHPMNEKEKNRVMKELAKALSGR